MVSSFSGRLTYWGRATHIWVVLWRHQMETFSTLLALGDGNPPVTDGSPSQSPVTRSFDVSFDLGLNKQFSEQSRRRRFETPSCSLWRQCSEYTKATSHHLNQCWLIVNWIGLDLFNDDTCPSGHISRPTHVKSYLHFLNKLLKPYYIVQVRGLVEVHKFHQIGGDSSDELYRMSAH